MVVCPTSRDAPPRFASVVALLFQLAHDISCKSRKHLRRGSFNEREGTKEARHVFTLLVWLIGAVLLLCWRWRMCKTSSSSNSPLAGLGKINGDVAGFGHVLAVAHLWWWKVRGVGVMNGMTGRKRQGRRVKALVQARQREKNYIC
jgi:hypothetical protein